MMDLPLARTTISYLLKNNDWELKAEGRVRSYSLSKEIDSWKEEEMSLIGFIPYSERINLINMNDDLIVTPFRIRFKNETKTYPVMGKVSIIENNKKYDIDSKLIIQSINDYCSFDKKLQSLLYDYYNTPQNSCLLLKYIDKITILQGNEKVKIYSGQITENEDKTLSYIPGKNELEFTRNYANPYFLSSETYKYVCIADKFLCLCSYINRVTGKPSYSLFTPEDIIKVVSDNPFNIA